MSTAEHAKIIGLKGTYPDSTGLGPDFPTSAGDRERGKFVPSSRGPRLNAVLVTEDGRENGGRIGGYSEDYLLVLATEIRKLRLALTLKGACEDLGDLSLRDAE